MMKRKISVLALLLGFALTLASCASGAPAASSGGAAAPSGTAPPASAPSQGGGEGEAITLRAAWWGGPARNDMMNAIYDRYQELHPGVTIEREYSEWGDYWIKYSTQVAGGNPPDIIQFTDRELKQYVAQNAVLPLDGFVESGVLNLNDFSEAAISAGRVDGKIYMVAMGLSTPLIEYNQTAIEGTGMELPGEDMTWQELEDYLLRLKDTDKLPQGMYCLQDMGGEQLWFESFLRQKGKTYCDENGQVGFTQEDAAQWFSWFDKMRDAGVVPPYSITAQYDGKPKEEAMIVKGTACMFEVAGNQSKIYQNNTHDKLALMRLPSMPDGVSPHGEIIAGAYLSVSPTSQHQEEAVRVIDYFVNDIEANKIFNCEQGIPGTTVVQEAIAGQMDPMDVKVKDLLNITLEDIPNPEPKPNGSLAIASALLAANQQIAYDQMSIEEAAAQFVKDSQKALDEAAGK